MTEKAIGFPGLATTVPNCPVDGHKSDPSLVQKDSIINESPLLGIRPKSKISVNFIQVTLNGIFYSIACIIFGVLIYLTITWLTSIYLTYKYEKISEALNTNIAEKLPPVDEGHVLNKSELLYCLAENKRTANQKNSVSRFNILPWTKSYKEYVDDFNARCAHKKYLRIDYGDVENVYKENVKLYESQGQWR